MITKKDMIVSVIVCILTIGIAFSLIGWIDTYNSAYELSCRADCSDIRYYHSNLTDGYCFCSEPSDLNFPTLVQITKDNEIYDANTGEWLTNTSKPLEERMFITIKELKGGNN